VKELGDGAVNKWKKKKVNRNGQVLKYFSLNAEGAVFKF
jgi:hypothetical protein